jgi:hypothetical protein
MNDNSSSPKRRRPTSNRSLVLDVVALCDREAYFPLEKTFDVAELAALRTAHPRRISWPILFMKAYATVAAVTPALRRAFIRWPWPHLCEYPDNVGMLAVNRQFADEDRLCWARFIGPERESLVQLQTKLDSWQRRPVEEAFKGQVQLSRLPTSIRRLIWRANLNFSGRKRARRLGTFTMSCLAGQGAVNRFHPTLATSSLTFGPLDAEGKTLVTLICDHRVFDGVLGARVLADLETTLRGAIANELRLLAPSLPRSTAGG